jgi:hypothetical protein
MLDAAAVASAAARCQYKRNPEMNFKLLQLYPAGRPVGTLSEAAAGKKVNLNSLPGACWRSQNGVQLDKVVDQKNSSPLLEHNAPRHMYSHK